MVKKIKWQDVIELDSKMQPEVKSEVSAALDKIVATKFGQKLFSDIKNVNEREPKDKVWSYGEKLALLPPQMKSNAEYEQSLQRERKFPQKIFLHGVTSSNRNIPMSYSGDVHLLYIDLSKKTHAPKQGKGGNRYFESIPLDEVLAHELGHVPSIRDIAFKKTDHTKPCIEAIAVDLENAYRREVRPASDPRYSYIGADLRLEGHLSNPAARGIRNSSDVSQETIAARKVLLQDTMMAVFMDSGCKKTPSNQEVLDQAVDLMRSKGISFSGVELSLPGGGRMSLERYRMR